ncbi:MAG: hypothetical protein JOZ41_13650 [Chloroflexi bacterium]|nr:hypothetical protein [Chloroflexota bacterium]
MERTTLETNGEEETMRQILLAACLATAGFGWIGLETSHVALADGNSAAAHLCQHGGYLDLMGSDGTRFSNAGDCTSFAAQGGVLVPVPTCTVVSGVSGCVFLNSVSLRSDSGYTATLTGAFSFPAVCASPDPATGSCAYNSGATGSGTYTIMDTTGATIQQGNFVVTGSSSVRFSNVMGQIAPSCTGSTYQFVTVPVTLLASATGATTDGSISASNDGPVFFISDPGQSFSGGVATVAC